MSRQIIKQPNGLYCVFSSVVDNFVMYDADVEGLIEEQVEEFRKRITAGITKTCRRLDEGDKTVYHQFTMSFDEACEMVKRLHGKNDETLKEVRDAASKPVTEGETQ